MSLEIPKNIDGWNYNLIEQLVDIPFEETEELEYLSSAFNLGREKSDVERKICSLANTNGGFIIFGVKENRSSDGKRLESLEIRGVEKFVNRENRIANIIKQTKPLINFDFKTIDIPNEQNKCVIVINIKKSQDLPVQSSQGIYYIRIQSSSERMNRDTIKNLFFETDLKIQRKNALLFELEDIEKECNILLIGKKEDWTKFPAITNLYIDSLKNAIVLNYPLIQSNKTLKKLFDSLVSTCRGIMYNVDELKIKIAAGGFISKPLVNLRNVEKPKKRDTFYGSYNYVTFDYCEHIIKTLKKIYGILKK